MPATAGEPLPTEALSKLGDLLGELTDGESPSAVHAAILERAGDPAADARLAGVGGLETFTAAWTALRTGSPPAADTWQAVVLPAVLAFSNQQSLKSHLGLATSLWLAWARAADNQAATTTEETEAEPDGAVPPEPPVIDDTVPAPAQRRRTHRVLAVGTVLTLLAVAALVWSAQADPPIAGFLPWAVPRPPAAEAGQAADASPSPASTAPGPAGTAPTGRPTPAPPSTLPVPSPTWSGTGPLIAPSAPQDLSVTGATPTTVSLSWRAPADAGTAGIAYYRVIRDGADAGWTTATGATLTALAPATSYTFTVTAVNGAGLASPASGAITATTPPQPQTQPPAPTQPAPPPMPQTPAPQINPALATDPPGAAVTLGESFSITGSGWPCTAPATIRVLLGGRLVSVAGVSAEGTFRTTIVVDAGAATVDVLDDDDPLTLTTGPWTVTAELPAQSQCTATPVKSLQIAFRA